MADEPFRHLGREGMCHHSLPLRLRLEGIQENLADNQEIIWEKKGFISQELKELIDNAKGGFVTPNRIVVGNELELLGNRLHYFALYYPKVYEFFNFMARCLGFFITQKRKVIGFLGL